MSSLDIATFQPSLQANLVRLRAQTIVNAKTLPNPWKQLRFSKHLEGHLHVQRGKLVNAAVATLETKSPVLEKTDQRDSLSLACSCPSSSRNGSAVVDEDVEQVHERERLRRMRISKANRGNTPWNKGRKHSPETLQKIRERTKIAMQNPQIKMKLANLGHAQSEETRMKIGEGVRLRWERRKERKMVQERCHYEWQNLIAEAARVGHANEAELQWDSYKVLDEQLQQEWLETVEQRKAMQEGGKGNRRAPKPFEQRRKIAEAIAAKWADPAYRERVCSALLKYHGTPDGTEKRRRKPSGNAEPRKRSPSKKSAEKTVRISSRSEQRSQNQLVKLRRRKTSVYKDPLASSKLEMIKSIRAKRAEEESRKIEAIRRARLLIAEAEKAAKALEVAATKSPVAQASLLESRKLIAEATLLIESIDSTETASDGDGTFSSVLPSQPTSLVESNMESENRDTNEQKQGDINGAHMFPFSMNKDGFSITVNGNRGNFPLNSTSSDSLSFSLEGAVRQSVSAKQPENVKTDRIIKLEANLQPNGTKVHLSEDSEPDRTTELPQNHVPNGNQVRAEEEKVMSLRPGAITKKWVRGRLVEVAEAEPNSCL
ncbi:PREDICTED: uncharacterized protein LOC104810398 [Tarenaya hassleriana]|uniref:uncharacterized protein LOC104810398 n=1 Tax=Tarenaya hassleriana TaxID=28532 RepID=UPI00053C4812|nr:PREDICTED: uncharacterized protein LOC104810398 [Tarenaya hassleriana]